MMIGEANRHNPTVHVPPWPPMDDPTSHGFFPFPFSASSPDGNVNGDGAGAEYADQHSSVNLTEALMALQRYLPSNDAAAGDFDSDSDASDILSDAFSCDQFRMFEFKVRRCARARSHDWTDCPYAHPGEKARRRDPRKYHYSGTACPDFRRGSCRKGDACEFAHGVFECWLHPARYRTQPCKDGTGCRRRVCFFAHTPEQLRVLSPRAPSAGELYDGSPLRQAIDASCAKTLPFMSSSLSISPPMTPPSESPPMSPMTRTLSRSLGSNSVNEMVASLRNLQLSRAKPAAASWVGSPGFGSPRGPMVRPGSFSLPSTPTRPGVRPGFGYMQFLDEGCEEEQAPPPVDRVESGRDLRARMFEKLSKENSLDRVNGSSSAAEDPDVGWVSELLK